uniref:Uncharacterized protein n=1 Tax=Arundo donax TaxID=35708 RepID=A0A0A9F3K7_ARUDO
MPPPPRSPPPRAWPASAGKTSSARTMAESLGFLRACFLCTMAAAGGFLKSAACFSEAKAARDGKER